MRNNRVGVHHVGTMKAILIVVAVIAISGCKHGTANWHPHGEFASGNIVVSSKNFIVPKKLSHIFRTEYLNYIHKAYPKIVLTKSEILSQIPRGLLDVTIYFMSGEQGVLSQNTEFDLPDGGGAIDLAGVVVGKKGSFYMHFNVHRAGEPKSPLKNLRIYFFSNTKQRKIGGNLFGAGCDRYMDVTKTLLTANSKSGFHLNATKIRYLPVIGGTFYFVSFGPNKKIYLSAVRIADSRYPSLVCPALN